MWVHSADTITTALPVSTEEERRGRGAIYSRGSAVRLDLNNTKMFDLPGTTDLLVFMKYESLPLTYPFMIHNCTESRETHTSPEDGQLLTARRRSVSRQFITLQGVCRGRPSRRVCGETMA
ncbi:hypothetical protein J6590_073429 [Homalodisca vitripennis]|nr:hypothetical protein J6590_073429 [Homalodisca vitripennis]